MDSNDALALILSAILLILACVWLLCVAGACGAAAW